MNYQITDKTRLQYLVELRQESIDAHIVAYDARMIAYNKSNAACNSTRYVHLSQDDIDLTFGNDLRVDREKYKEKITKTLDISMWNSVLETFGIEKLMSSKERKKFKSSILDDHLPFTEDAVLDTLEGLRLRRWEIFCEGVATTFSNLDRRFKSHDGFKIGSRVILPRLISEWGGVGSYSLDMLMDIERSFLIVNGEEPVEYKDSVLSHLRRNVKYDTQQEFDEYPYFRIKTYKNGNAHLWFRDKEDVKKINLVLASHYGETIGEGSEVADKESMPEFYHVTPAKNFGFFETSDETAKTLMEYIEWYRYNETGKIRILEPSAGRGSLLRNIPSNVLEKYDIEFITIEIQPDNCAILRNKGYKVHNKDFLTMKVEDLGKFDLILMNPPFDKGRDVDHVTHATKFLADNGKLVAIMSARAELSENARHRAFHKLIKRYKPLGRYSWQQKYWSDLPEKSFAHAGTNVNTVILGLSNEKT